MNNGKEEEIKIVEKKNTLVKVEDCLEYVYIFDPNQLRWERQKCKGKLPLKRTYHIAWYENSKHMFIVFGGLSEKDKVL